MSQQENMPVKYTADNDPLCALAERYGMLPGALYDTLKASVFRGANDTEFQALCLISKTYGLNPLLKEIYAFPSRGGVVPMVGVDGYTAMMHRQPDFDGMEFAYSENTVPAGNVKAAPEWVECRIYRKSCSRPTVVREYMDECWRPTEPWKTHPRRMLRHKALCQCVRTAFGFSGVYSDADEIEAVTVQDAKPNVNAAIAQAIEAQPAPAPAPAQPKRRGRPPKQPVQPVPAPAPEPQPEPVQESQPAKKDNCGVTNNAITQIEATFDDYIFDNGFDPIKANDVCMRLVQDGVARDLVDAKRQFVEHSMSV